MSSRAVWQADIRNQHIKLERLGEFEGLRDATSNTNLMTLPGKQKAKAFVCVLVVIYDQDANSSEPRSHDSAGRPPKLALIKRGVVVW